MTPQDKNIRALEILGWKWRTASGRKCRALLPDGHKLLWSCWDGECDMSLPIAGDQAQYLIDFTQGDAFLQLIDFARSRGYEWFCETNMVTGGFTSVFWQGNSREPARAETLQEAVLNCFLAAFDTLPTP